ncbi:hypothetical protein Z517_06675 [Fonsecaea pedrosoi CBS 271.37]|uniref:Unplaced genomic scaffold supercont1.4, whole genome shotgun sequence n=1 Tax=Fonsecaea pedrosoi CBS 271.37 TaxID=1442368 RepID=A0A0D2GNF1_9EURO|nr:uncharacterized protein Z517_06675 [Fonsecaea pedrosoi CBS 271.37]KIW80060.1 hypothetical protein Z517_06675 [Fonsecaea pedrosoi CBS 271.37]
MSVEGRCDERFFKVKELFQGFLDSGAELGASICVNIDGKNVIDLWGGWADQERTKPWTENTIVNVWSTTKTVLSLATLILADRGLLGLDDPVAKYWPEFAAEGKSDVKVRHLLSHTSGLSGWDDPIDIEGVEDVPSASAKLAAQRPWWEPGTASGYHALTMGHLLQPVIQAASGKTLGQVVNQEIAGPLKADFSVGCPESEWHRVAKVVPPPHMDLSQIDPKSVMAKTLSNPLLDAKASWTDEWKRVEMGALNGHGNARSVCKMLSAITLGGEVDGQRLLSPATIDRIWETQSNGTDLVLGIEVRFGIGYCLEAPILKWLPKGKVCFWGGWGGSIVVMDLDKKITFAYTMNHMEQGTIGNSRSSAYVAAFYEALS